MGAYVENVLLRCDVRTATWLSHGDRNDEQQLGGARLRETDPGRRGRAVFGASRHRWAMDPPVTAGVQAAAVGSLRCLLPLPVCLHFVCLRRRIGVRAEQVQTKSWCVLWSEDY